MPRTSRRSLLQATGGGLAGILATGRVPAFAQGTTLHWLRLGDFVPASDALLRKELQPEAERALGLKIKFETINGNDLQARIHLGDPVRDRCRRHTRDAQLAAA